MYKHEMNKIKRERKNINYNDLLRNKIKFKNKK